MFDGHKLGSRVRLLRQAAGLDQATLGELAGVGQQALVSRIENGRVALTPELVEDLAQALDCSAAFLADAADAVPPRRPWLRAYADAPKRDVDRQLAECQVVAEVIERLALRTMQDLVPSFDGDLEDEQAIEDFALEVRQAAELPDGAVVGNTIRTAERLGCIVLPMSGELGRHLGMSTYADLRPMICVSRGGEENPDLRVPGDRQRFTVAHEIGHLGLHRTLPAPNSPEDARKIEGQAHRFAGAFLIPGDALREEVEELGGRVTLRALAEVKGRWGIAIKALVVRCRQLGIVDDDHARSLYKQISSRGWNRAEPVPVGSEQAVWLAKAIGQATGTVDSIAAASEMLGIGRSHLERWTRWEPDVAVEADVIDLADRHRSARSGPRTGETANVRPFRGRRK